MKIPMVETVPEMRATIDDQGHGSMPSSQGANLHPRTADSFVVVVVVVAL